MTTQVADASSAAKIAVDRLPKRSDGKPEGVVTPETLRRYAREGFERWYDKATVAEAAEIEDDLVRRGMSLRPDSAHALISSLVDALSGGRSSQRPLDAFLRWLERPASPSAIERFFAEMNEGSDRMGRLARFGSAFPDLFPPETKMRTIAAAYERARKTLMEEGGIPQE